MGLLHPDCGDVRVLGHHMPAEQVAAKRDIGFAPDVMRIYDSLTLGGHMNFIQPSYPNRTQPMRNSR
jgi:ABC-2 type transport system ATP-binding protein